MSAVAEKRNPVEIERLHAEMERKQQEQDAFVMPVMGDGEPVKFFVHGVRAAKYELAFIQKRNAKGMELRLANGLVKPNVPHVDDPRLKYSHEFRTDWGAWEATDWKQKLDEAITDLQRRVAELESLVSEPKKKGA